MKVVIDTNVVISAALGSRTCSKPVLKALDQGVIEPRYLCRSCEGS